MASPPLTLSSTCPTSAICAPTRIVTRNWAPLNVRLHSHRLASLGLSLAENVLLWLECGLITLLAPICIHLVSSDLVLDRALRHDMTLA